MSIDKNIVATFHWSDQTWNSFMAHDHAAIEDFKSRKLLKDPGIRFLRRDVSIKEYDSGNITHIQDK